MFMKCQDRISNKKVAERTGISDINVEIKKRRSEYSDHILCRDIETLPEYL